MVTPGRLHGRRALDILVGLDSHSEVDLVGIDFARTYGLQEAEVTTPLLRGVGGHLAETFGAFKVPLELIDSRGRKRKCERVCLAVKQGAGDNPVLLGMPALSELGINLFPRSSSWTFELRRDHISIVSPRKFAQEAQQEAKVFAFTQVEHHNVWDPDEVLSNQTGDLPAEFAAYRDVFSPEDAEPLPPHSAADHAIDLLPGTQPPHGTIYPLSPRELEVLREYLDDALQKGWIQPSKSPAGAPILFVPKSDGSLRLCVDYRALNRITVKNRYPLPLIGEIINRVEGAKFFTKIDIKDAYHRLRIKQGDEWKTAFRTRYGHYEYLVLPFGLTNAPATFQSYVHQALEGLLDQCCIAYIDDILIYSETRDEHVSHVEEVLRRLRQFKLFANPKKCTFFSTSVGFLGFVISTEGVSMDPKRVRTIQEWPTPKTFHDIQVLLGFCNYYRRFIQGYSHLTAPLTAHLQGMQNGRKPGNVPWGDAENKAFQSLQAAFLGAPLLRHFQSGLPTRVETDASNFAMAGILSQQHQDGLWHPVAFWSRKFNKAEANYSTTDKELFAIVSSFEEWRQYLDGVSGIVVLTDHANLQGLSQQTKLLGRQARWLMRLAPYEFEIKHRPGTSNPADGPSRRPDYASGFEFEDLLPELKRKVGVMQATMAWDLHGDSANSMPAQEVPAAEGPFAARARTTKRQRVLIRGQTRPAALVASAMLPASVVPAQLATASEGLKRQRVLIRGQARPAALVASAMLPVSVLPAQVSPATEGPLAARVRRSKRQWGEMTEQVLPAAVATAVARTSPGASGVSEDLRSLIKRVQEIDPESQAAVAAIGDEAINDDWSVDSEGLLRKHQLVFVPSEATLRRAILSAYHDEPVAGHFGKGRTLHALQRKFWWKGMAEDVADYVASCSVCQRSKSRRHPPYGELQSLPVPNNPWQEVSMDFIVGLPPIFNGREEVDSILVVVDRMTKMVRFLPTVSTITAVQLEELLHSEVWLRFGPPQGIVTDRGSVFTSQYWEEVCFLMQTKRRLSTAFHPQTDGQTERNNQTLEQYLRCFIDVNQRSWPTLLQFAEFAANNAVNASTTYAPHELLMGYVPDFNLIAEDGARTEGVPAAENRLRKIDALRKDAQQRMLSAQQSQKHYHDKHHKPIEFARGDLVLLSTKNLQLKVPNKKLAPKFIGPFRVLERVGKVAYRLALPAQYSRLHNVFSVSLLEPWLARVGDSVDPTESMPMHELNDDPNQWTVEQVIAKKKIKSQLYYLVKWLDWPTEYNSWVASDDINHPDAIKDFEKTAARKRRRRA